MRQITAGHLLLVSTLFACADADVPEPIGVKQEQLRETQGPIFGVDPFYLRVGNGYLVQSGCSNGDIRINKATLEVRLPAQTTWRTGTALKGLTIQINS